MPVTKGGTPEMPGPRDGAAFDALYEMHKNHVYKFACYLAENRREAEDLFQETWLRVARHFPRTPEGQDAKAWILTITANLHRDALRRKRIRGLIFSRQTDGSPYRLESAENAWGGKRSGTEERAERAETARAIHKALTALPAKQRRIFILKEVEGFKHSEISEILGLPVGTIKSQLFRAVKRLQRELTAYGPGGSKNWEVEKCGAKTSSG